MLSASSDRRTSQIAPATNKAHGKGLFATNGASNGDVVFKNAERIIKHNGEVLDKAELDDRYGGNDKDIAPYGFQVNKNKHVDSACLRSAGSLANKNRYRRPMPSCISQRATGACTSER